MSGHEKIIALQPIINNSLWLFHIARKDCSLYNKTENTWVLENKRFTSRVEHLNKTFTIIFISYIPTLSGLFVI